MTTHGVTMRFGKHVGERLTRVPVSYLKWMVCNQTQQADLAAEELKRRGTTTPNLDVSGHAIDSFSKRWLNEFMSEVKRVGLHSLMVRLAEEAHAKLKEGESRVEHEGPVWVFTTDGVWPVLKTVL